VRAPTSRHVYTCPCGRRVVAIQSDGTWAAWAVFERLAEEHAADCPRARERWTLALPNLADDRETAR
jgi:hypothetical protein